MKRIRLSEDDYITMFPFARPIEIRREFGEHSHCIAQIRNKYKKLKYDSQFKALKLFRQEAMKMKPIDISWVAWERRIEKDIAERRETAFAKVHARLNDRKNLYARGESDVG